MLALLLALCMALALLPAAALAAEDDPKYGEDRAEGQISWSGAGYTEYWDRLGNYQGTSSPACRNAGGHNWTLDGRFENRDKTCLEFGINHYICRSCGCTMTRYSKATGHWHSVYASPEEHQDPTCTEAGYDKYRCYNYDNCREYITEEIPALGHSWAMYNVVRPSRTETGHYDYRCQRCGATYSEPIPMLSSYSIPPLMTTRKNSEGKYEKGTESQFRNLFDKTEDCVTFSQHSATLNGVYLNRVTTAANGAQTLTIGEAAVRDANTKRLVAIVYAGELTSGHSQDYIDVLVEEDSIDVYLVDFGTMGKNASRKGLRNLTVTGDYVNVYLVNSHIGMIESTGTNTYPVYSGGSEGSVRISLSGFSSHIYMGASANSARPGNVHAVVTVDTPFYSEEEPLINHNGHKLEMVYNPGSPNYPFRMFNLDRGLWVDPQYTHTPKLELANLTVDSLGSPANGTVQNGTLRGLGGAKLIGCNWTVENIELRDFSQLELENTTLSAEGSSGPDFVLHERSELTLGGTVTGNIRVRGTNTLRLNSAVLNGTLLLEGDSDDYYDAIGERFVDWNGKPHYLDLKNGANYAYNGANLSLLLGGESYIQLPAYFPNGGETPGIMVDQQAIMTVKDDPEREGVGALTVRTMDSYGNPSSPYYAFSAIGGAPALESPLRHGWIFVQGGVLNLRGYSGSAALGGSALDGFSPDGGALTVTGGVVNAEAEYGAAAIGGAKYGDGGRIAINGGATVNANTRGGGAAIGGGLPKYEEYYQLVGYQLLRITYNGGPTGIYLYPDENGDLRYLNSGWYGSAENTVTAGNLYKPVYNSSVESLEPYDKSAIYKKMLDYVGGGGSGNLVISGGCAVSAWADNPLYGGGDSRVDRGYTFYHPLNGEQTEHESFDPTGLYLYDEDNYTRYHSYYDNAQVNGEDIYTSCYFSRETVEGSEEMKLVTHPIDDLYVAVDDNEIGGMPSYKNGRLPGYVLGCACEDAVFTYGNFFELCGSRGLSPAVVLGQYASGPKEAAWDRYYAPDYGSTTIHDQNEEHGIWIPSIVSLYDSFVLRIGNHCESNSEGYTTFIGYILRHELLSRAYSVQGQINLSIPERQESDPLELTLPRGATLKLLSGGILNVGDDITVYENAEDEGQFIVEDGAIVRGKGMWPRKPADPEAPPTANQVRSLLARIRQQSSEGGEGSQPTVVTHLGVVQTDDGRMVLSGNSLDEIRQQMAAAGLTEDKLLTVFSAGDSGFKMEMGHDQYGGDVITWRLNTYSTDTVISLVPNGALVATPGPYMLANDHLDLILTEKSNSVTVMLKSARLSTPEYCVFEGTGDEELELHLEKPGSKTAFTIQLDEDQIVNNKCIFAVPKFAGSEFTVSTLAPLRDRCAMRFGGTMSFTTPVSDIAGVTVNELQLNYDGGLALGGINGGGYVKIPDIGGFPVTGSAKLDLNTFAPNRKLSLDVTLDTPIFSGAFRGGFKEARGVIMLDSLYAELSVGKGGIPLVPPTVIGYLQGGGLGISGLADTVAMDGPGAVPLRLEIAAKASIIDVVSGWARVSVGPTGFDLDLEDIKVAGYDWIKKFGASASLITGEKTIDGIKYWGVDTDLSTYLVVGIPLKSIGYGNTINDDETVAGLSATGTVGIGCFAGYNKSVENGATWLYFIYQLRASASLSGSLTIPKGIVGGYLPLSTVTVGSLDLGFYAEANAKTRVNASEVADTESPMNLLRQLSNNVDLDFNAAIGAKASAGVGKARVYVRAVYVLGEKSIDLDYGFGSGGKLDLQGALMSDAVSTSGYDTELTAVLMENSDEPVPAIVQTSAYSAAKLGGPVLLAAEDTLGMGWNPDGSVSVTVNQAMAGNAIVGLKLDRMVTGLSAANVSVTRGGSAVTLIPEVYDVEGGSMVANANFTVGSALLGDAEVSSICFVPDTAGTYIIKLIDVSADFTDGDVIITRSFATLDTGDTTLGDASLSYRVVDAAEGGRYKVQLFLGEEKGSGDYLLAETEELTDSTMDGSVSVSFSGNLAPGGSYCPTILLLEYVDATDGTGQSVGTWAAVDQINLDSTVNYVNSEEIPAPASVTLSYSGNGSMTAAWSAVEGADSYRLTVYRETANTVWDEETQTFVPAEGTHFADSGLLFETADTSALMDLSSLYGENAAAQNLKVGVRAIKAISGSEGQTRTGRECLSDAARLKVPTPPTVSYSDNVRLGEGSSHSIVAGASGTAFTVAAGSGTNITVTGSLSATTTATDTGTLKVEVPAPTEDSLSATPVLEVTVKDDATGDYTLNYISVSYDTVAPPLILDRLGRFPKWGSDAGLYAEITGHTEAGVTVNLYDIQYGEYDGAFTYVFLTAVTAAGDGSFSIPVHFTGAPAYCVQAMDGAGNQSVALTVDFPESDVVVNLDANGGGSSVSSIGLADGGAIGALPTPVSSESNEVFDGWVLMAAPFIDSGEDEVVELDPNATVGTETTGTNTEGTETTDTETTANEAEPAAIPVTADTVFTRTDAGETLVSDANGKPLASFSGDPILHAQWTRGVTVSFEPGEGAACDLAARLCKVGSAFGELPVPRRTDGGSLLFLGWFCGAEKYTETSVVTENTALTARWATPVTVTFDTGLGGLELGDVSSEAITDSSLVIPMGSAIETYPSAVATGYTFTGWYNGEKPVSAGALYIIDTTLTAHWERNTAALTVTQDSISDTQTLPEPVITWPTLPEGEEWAGEAIVSYVGTGETEYLSSAKPTKAGSYEVVVHRDTFETAYVGSAEFTIARTGVTLYDITVDSVEHGSVSVSRTAAAQGDTVTLTAAPDAGYAFQSWSVTRGDTPVTVTDDRFTMPDGAVTVSAAFVEKQVVTLSTSSSPEGGNIRIETDTPTRIHAGDSVTLTAPARNGYQFLGWFKVPDDTGNPECTTLTYRFTMEENTELQARYEAVGQAEVEINTANGAKYHVGTDSSIQNGQTRTPHALGTVLTIYAEDPGSVLQWQNESGKVMGRGASLTLTVTDSMKVTLVYRTPENNQSIVQFVSGNDQVLRAQQYAAGISADSISFPAPPSKVGYIFEKWVFEGTENEAAPETILAKLGKEPLITVIPAYTKDETAYAVTVNYSGDGLAVPAGTFAGITVGTGYTVTAPELDGYRFECWKLRDTVLSYKDSYFLQVTGNVTLTACYVAESQTVAVQPVIALTKLFTGVVGDAHKVTAVATRSVPEGYTVLEQGMLYGKELDSLTEETFRYGTEGVRRYQSGDLSRNGVLNMNLSVSTDELVVFFRGYMILRNESTGNTETCYTEIWKGSYARGRITD